MMISKCITTRRLDEAAKSAAITGCDTSMTVLPGGILLHRRGGVREDIDFLSWAEITGPDENLLLSRMKGLTDAPRRH